ncbi:uncharacterized protein LOC143150638 [Ptiloglossa arizonensis]|uniref:uncharacterized protein LOC143150638 n=1 Tax=Ptiloglossa arizonensis TaxID=3350558 RepID=UPI003F9F2886
MHLQLSSHKLVQAQKDFFREFDIICLLRVDVYERLAMKNQEGSPQRCFVGLESIARSRNFARAGCERFSSLSLLYKFLFYDGGIISCQFQIWVMICLRRLLRSGDTEIPIKMLELLLSINCRFFIERLNN